MSGPALILMALMLTPALGQQSPVPFPPVTREHAQVPVRLSWQPPLTRVDGSPLDPADISEYRLYEAGELFNVVLPADLTTAPDGRVSIVYVLPRPGYYSFTVTAVAGGESDHSNTADVRLR